MSSFVPLNITRDPSISKHELEEEHTRELQIEQAFKMFQEALDLQRQREYLQSYNIYEELFKLDVIGSHYYEEEDYLRGLQNGGTNNAVDEVAFLSPTIKTLRYLVFRNRGFLYFDMLKTGNVSTDTYVSSVYEDSSNITKQKEMFYTMIEDMCASLIYQEADEGLLERLYEIFIYLDNKKLARFTLEYYLTGRSESDDLLGLMPTDKNILDNYRRLLDKLHAKKDGDTNLSFSIISKELSFLDFIKLDFKEQIVRNEELTTFRPEIQCNRSEMNWGAVVDSIDLQLKKLQDKSKVHDFPRSKFKYIEPYFLTEKSNERVIFEFPTDNEMDLSPPMVDIRDSKEEELETSTNNNNENNDNNQTNPDVLMELINEERSISSNIIDGSTEGVESNKNECDNKVNAVVQRSSKRFKPRNEGISYESMEYELKKADFNETQKFFEILNSYFSHLQNFKSLHLANIIDFYLPIDGNSERQEIYLQDYLEILNDWSLKFTTSMISSDNSTGSTADDRVKLLDVLKTFGNKNRAESTEDVLKLSDLDNSDRILEFLRELNSKPYTYMDMKFCILKHLLAYKSRFNSSENLSCLVEQTLWENSLFEKVSDWVIEFDSIILNHFKRFDFTMENYSFAVSTFEILVDAYMDLRFQINKTATDSSKKGGNKGSKSSINTLCLEMSKLGDKLNKWIAFFDIYHSKISHSKFKEKCHFKLYCRYTWAKIYREKSKNDDWLENKHVISQLETLLNDIIRYDEKMHIALPNYRNINEINCKSIKSHLTTCHVLSMFAKLICADSEVINTDAISLLESILFEEKATKADFDDHVIDESTLTSIKKFLEKSSIDMKLSLWNILFSYYNSDILRYKYGFERSLEFILVYLKNGVYRQRLDSSRYIELAKILGFYGTIISDYVKLLRTNHWQVPLGNTKIELGPNFQNILLFFELLYLFSVHEEAALLSSSKVSVKARSIRAYGYFKDLFIETVSLLIIYYKTMLFSDIDNPINNDAEFRSFLALVHEQLGLRRLCDSSQGFLLNLLQDNFTELNIETEKDLSQVIMCRYHYKLNVKNFTPTDHETTFSDTVDIESTKCLANFVLPLCFKKNPLTNIPKHDMKQIIDDFYEVVGDPDLEKSKVLKKNSSILDSFLDTTLIKPKLLRDTFYGLSNLDLDNTVPQNSIINSGLYYLQGLLIFSSYKIRKKNMQSRAVELENVIKLLKNDLIYCNNRIESWLLLGQAYGYSVEDDLIWTSDKLTIPERKVVTANLQRKSILCYLMAINESSHHMKDSDKDYVKPVISTLTASFSKEMYSACMQPMDMHTFKVQSYPKLVRSSSGVELVNISKNSSVSKRLCLKIMQQSLQVAIRRNSEDWTNFYYLSKIQRKLQKDPSVVLSTLHKASMLAKDLQLADPIIEPHYLLCSMLYKYVKKNKLTANNAISYLEQDPVIQHESPNAHIYEKNEFYQAIVDSLKKINSYDKKKWHHKPRYRLAKILDEEFGKSSEALEEMSSFVSLKSSNKTLVSIWKPENERPGKHFCYTYQYAQFYLNILAKQSNLTGLIQMLPKLRRSNATMVSLYNAWENLCSSICKLIRSSLDVDENFTENIMQSLTYQEFSKNSKEVIEIMKDKGVPTFLEAHLCYLHAINDMKKFNNGFGPTSLIDDTLVAIYLRIYFHFEKHIDSIRSQITPVTESPSNKVKKLAKRYVFPFTIDILKHFKRNIDLILKEKPNIFNDFLSEVSENKKIATNSENTENCSVTIKTPLLNSRPSPMHDLQNNSKNDPTNDTITHVIDERVLNSIPDDNDISNNVTTTDNIDDSFANSEKNENTYIDMKHKIEEDEHGQLKRTKIVDSDKESDMFVDCVENF